MLKNYLCSICCNMKVSSTYLSQSLSGFSAVFKVLILNYSMYKLTSVGLTVELVAAPPICIAR